jgi:hypothetical protein
VKFRNIKRHPEICGWVSMKILTYHDVEAIVEVPSAFALHEAFAYRHREDMHIDYQAVKMVQDAVTS